MSSLPPPLPGSAGPPRQAGQQWQPWQSTPGVEHPQGTTILVLGILSLVVCGILGPFAWNMGNKTLREMDANPGVVYRNRGNVTAGRLCGMIGCALMVLQVLLFFVWIVALARISDPI
ncbi:MAG: DUF4190 domain-containing protein [Actinomycetota bacterium]|jgi:hypothetical protein